MDIFQGDPLIQIKNSGATLVFKGGQPIMDTGLENQVSISLFTRKGWPGNFLLEDSNKIGSDFEIAAKKPITLRSLSELEKVAENAVSAPVFGNVNATAINPTSSKIDLVVRVEPPGGTPAEILLTNNGQNWLNQANNPAHKRVE